MTTWALSECSRVVKLRNGRAEITVSLPKGRCTVSACAEGVPTVFTTLESR